ncbi:MAG: hypothetical protein Q9184_003398 [Pyrenodesmia sp. 2 TL-2023]
MGTILDSAQGISAFEWYLQPLSQLPIAEECSIEVPWSVRSSEKATISSQQYAQSITRHTRLAHLGEQEARQIGYAMRQYPYGFEPGIRLWDIGKLPLWWKRLPLWWKVHVAKLVFEILVFAALFALCFMRSHPLVVSEGANGRQLVIPEQVTGDISLGYKPRSSDPVRLWHAGRQ